MNTETKKDIRIQSHRLFSTAICLFAVMVFAVVVKAELRAEPPVSAISSGIMPEIFPAEDVEVGDRGVGYTSFRGTELKEFEFEVLGVLRSWQPQGKVFLVELEHPVLEKSGVIAGMSGSPLFIDGRLLGAVAYGFQYSLTALAGVTPAEEMMISFEAEDSSDKTGLSELERKAHARDFIARRSEQIIEDNIKHDRGPEALMLELVETFSKSLRWPESDFRKGIKVQNSQGLSPEQEAGISDLQLRPLPVPMSISGVDISRLGDLKSAAAGPAGLMPVQAPGADRSEPLDTDKDLQPGTPVGAVLMSGDIDIASMGTLTFSDGNRVAAFGHPMSDLGETDLPLALGHVETIVPSRLISFRLTSSGPTIGSLVQDRHGAIIGEIGREAPTIPARVNISGFHDATYEYELAGHWQYAPMMALYAASMSALKWEGFSEFMTVDASVKIDIKGREEPLILENIYAGNPQRPAFDLVMAPVQSLMLNPFEEAEIEHLDIDFRIGRELKAAQIESVRLEKQEARPGEKLRMWVRLREFQGPEQIKEIYLKIPEDAEIGKVAGIRVSDASTIMASKYRKDPGLFQPRDFEGLIEAIQVIPINTRLYVSGDFIKTGLRYDGEPMPSLPGSIKNMLEFGTLSGRTRPLTEDIENSIDTPWVLQGSQQVQVKIVE